MRHPHANPGHFRASQILAAFNEKRTTLAAKVRSVLARAFGVHDKELKAAVGPNGLHNVRATWQYKDMSLIAHAVNALWRSGAATATASDWAFVDAVVDLALVCRGDGHRLRLGVCRRRR